MKLVTKIKKELNDIFGITMIGKVKNNVVIYLLNEDYRKMVCELLKDKLTLEEFELVKIVVHGPIIPAED
jgi:hypothetical protein